MILLYLGIGDVDEVDDDCDDDDKTGGDMHCVMIQIHAAGAKQHIEWNEELEERDKYPQGNHICRPEEEKGIQHVKGSSDADDGPANRRCSLDIEQLVEPASLLLLLYATHSEIEDAIKHGYH